MVFTLAPLLALCCFASSWVPAFLPNWKRHPMDNGGSFLRNEVQGKNRECLFLEPHNSNHIPKSSLQWIFVKKWNGKEWFSVFWFGKKIAIKPQFIVWYSSKSCKVSFVIDTQSIHSFKIIAQRHVLAHFAAHQMFPNSCFYQTNHNVIE